MSTADFKPDPEDRFELASAADDAVLTDDEFSEEFDDEILDEDEYVYEDEEEEEDDDEELDDKQAKTRRRLFCFSCNRTEAHYQSYRRRWYYSFVVGMTFGLMHGVGPFRCKCCGNSRLMISDGLNPRYWFRSSRPKSSRSKSRR
ncbi:MAG: hypothetical protein AAF456_18345 [Planctomycetota bacterium]